MSAGLVAGSAHRQLTRSLGCAPSTVTRLSARLGRHALLLQAEALAALEGRVNEPFAWDHFESFVFSQDDRLGVGTPVGTAYRAAIRGDPRIDHRVYPNLRRGAKADRVAAERDQEMFAVDLFHKLLRHSQAHHRRETIAFARRSNALLERMALMVVWRNFVKKISERSKKKPPRRQSRGGLEQKPRRAYF